MTFHGIVPLALRIGVTSNDGVVPPELYVSASPYKSVQLVADPQKRHAAALGSPRLHRLTNGRRDVTLQEFAPLRVVYVGSLE